MIKELAKSIREYKKQAILTPLSVAAEVVLEVIVPYFMALLIDEGINKASMDNTIRIGIALVAFTVLSLFFDVVCFVILISFLSNSKLEKPIFFTNNLSPDS